MRVYVCVSVCVSVSVSPLSQYLALLNLFVRRRQLRLFATQYCPSVPLAQPGTARETVPHIAAPQYCPSVPLAQPRTSRDTLLKTVPRVRYQKREAVQQRVPGAPRAVPGTTSSCTTCSTTQRKQYHREYHAAKAVQPRVPPRHKAVHTHNKKQYHPDKVENGTPMTRLSGAKTHSWIELGYGAMTCAVLSSRMALRHAQY
eukprot:1271443-Rhodomonas_salina.1